MKISRRLVRAARLAAAACALTACQEAVDYSYVSVDVSFDATVDKDMLAKVAGCTATVTGARRDGAGLGGCDRGKTKAMLGTFNYSTSATSGILYFEVVAADLNNVPIARGSTGAVNLIAGGVATAAVTLRPEPNSMSGATTADAGP